MTQDAAVQWSTAHPEKEVQWSDLSLLALPQGYVVFCKAEPRYGCQKNLPRGMGQLYPLTLGEPGFLPVKRESLENKVEDTQDMQGQPLALLGSMVRPDLLKKKISKPRVMGEAVTLPLSQPELCELIPGRRHISLGELVPACSAESAGSAALAPAAT